MDYCIKCSQPLFHGTIPHRCIADIPCPSCAALRARIEVLEKVAEEIKRLREAVIEAGKEVGYERPVDAYETGVNAGVDSVLKFIYRRAKVSP